MFEREEVASGASLIPNKGWLENELFCDMKRFSNIVAGGVATFLVVYSVIGFAVTGDPIILLIMFFMLSTLALSNMGIFGNPQRIRMSEKGIQLRYWGPKSDRILPWNQVRVVQVKERPYGLLHRGKRYLLAFRNLEGKRMTMTPIVVFRDLYDAIRNALALHNPQIKWQEL
ncbi:MAG: hypothetical protein V3U09_03595 [Thermoplasmata archaeon]